MTSPHSTLHSDGLTLVTGATGLLGSTLTRLLVERGAAVRILRRESSQTDLLGHAADAVEHVFGDVTDPATLTAAFEGVTHVYHTAAGLGTGRPSDRRTLHAVNVVGTRNVVDAALRADVRRLVHTSSMAAFGRPEASGAEDAPLDERSEWTASRLNGPYAESKYLSELEVQRGVAEGLDAVLVNPALIFGVGRPGENTVQIVEMVRDGRMPAVPTGGTNVVDVLDVADGHLRAMDYGHTGERYFLGSENLRWREIIGALAGALGVDPPRRTASPLASLALAVLAEGAARLTGTAPKLTRERARQTAAFYRYTNARAANDLGCTFRPFAETARRVAAAFGKAGR